MLRPGRTLHRPPRAPARSRIEGESQGHSTAVRIRLSFRPHLASPLPARPLADTLPPPTSSCASCPAMHGGKSHTQRLPAANAPPIPYASTPLGPHRRPPPAPSQQSRMGALPGRCLTDRTWAAPGTAGTYWHAGCCKLTAAASRGAPAELHSPTPLSLTQGAFLSCVSTSLAAGLALPGLVAPLPRRPLAFNARALDAAMMARSVFWTQAFWGAGDAWRPYDHNAGA